MRYLVLIFLLVVNSFNVFSATYTTVSAGDWDTGSNWTGNLAPPQNLANGDIIVVNHNMTGWANHGINNPSVATINFNSDVSLTSFWLEGNGTFTVNIASGVTLSATTLTLTNGTNTTINNDGDISVTSINTNNNITGSISGNVTASGNVMLDNADLAFTGNLIAGGNLQVQNSSTITMNSADIAGTFTMTNGTMDITGFVSVTGSISITNSGTNIDMTNSAALVTGNDLYMDNSTITGLGVISWTNNITINNAGQIGDLDPGEIPPFNPFDLEGFEGVLPITLADFSGKESGDAILLEWSTLSEKNFHYFILQRSTDGINHTQIANIEGFGNSDVVRNYSYIDKNASLGIVYYRLISVDYDGYSETFDPISVKFNGGDNADAIQVYPNPIFRNELTVKYLPMGDETVEIALFDHTGNALFRSAVSESITIETEDLKPGMYYLKISNGQTLKLIRY